MTAEVRKRPGRKSKGDRKFFGFRIATERADIVNDIAAAEGYKYVSDWVASVIEDRIENTDLSAINRQEELPIGRIA
ncbi:hypothetical protein [Arthrobacter caoxuetaonis]|uniref:Uncharacterized protein n=1 Tax=Arthrobacter caoxuetaonis TaxID=2886935 RepID=A0A9X1SD37_9MICC|nr:hypothetical protein [Arthrobacter caoxuetaonis]MCC3299305.1 hypothetical protein [Arthrobacter caoxuetaonis]USQ59202.1 hypothetical protein NF551_16595 [Arthrobacter caoxuetaonis]